MSHHTATVQLCFEKASTTYDAALAINDRLYQIDEIYVQPFYRWIAPRLQDAVRQVIGWTVFAIANLCLWLLDTIERCADTDNQAIATFAWAWANAPAPEVLALAPALDISVAEPEFCRNIWILQRFKKPEPKPQFLPTVALCLYS